MRSLIIDASAAPFSDYVRRYGRTDGLMYGVWYRVARPAMVTLMWVFFALYIHHSLVTVGGTAAEIAELIVYVGIVAGMAALLVSWMIICGFHNWIRVKDMAETEALYQADQPTSLAEWPVPSSQRCIVVVHDDSGRIVAVEPWRDADVIPVPIAVTMPMAPEFAMRRAG